jgi:hypothetical protein
VDAARWPLVFYRLAAAPVSGYQDVRDRFSISDAGRGRAPADELADRRPHGQMLVTGGVVVPDEGHLLDAHGEQMEPSRLGIPAQRGTHGAGVAALDIAVMLNPGHAADLELSLTPVPAGDHAVHQDARITQQVRGLPRAPHHGQPQDAAEHERFHRANPGRAVTADRRNQNNALVQQTLLPQGRQARLRFGQLRPVHGSPIAADESRAPGMPRQAQGLAGCLCTDAW